MSKRRGWRNSHKTRRHKRRLFALDATCHWCRTPLTFDEATVDHEPPIAEGGTKEQAVLACYSCNQVRGQTTASRLL